MIISITSIGSDMDSKEAFSSSFIKGLVLETINTEIRKYLDVNFGIIIKPDSLKVKFVTGDIIPKQMIVCCHGFEIFSSQLQEGITTILKKCLKCYAHVPTSYIID